MALTDDAITTTNHGGPGPYPPIPAELIALILEDLKDEYAALFALSLTNRFMNEATQPVLYRSIHSIVSGTSTRTRPPRNGNRALTSIIGYASLAQYVLKYTLEDTFGKESSDFVTHRRSGLQAVSPNLGPALRAMVNLKHLSVETYCTDKWKLLDFGPSDPRNSPKQVPFQLETFSWTGHTRDASSSSYAHLSSFLITQRKLRRVEAQLNGRSNDYFGIDGVLCSRPQIPIPPNACPDLQWVIGNRTAIEALLPGRKVTIVVWKPCWSDARRSIAFLAKELGRLRVFSLHDGGFYGPIPPVFEMARYMQNLQYLEVHNMDFESLEWVKILTAIRGLILKDDRNRNRPFKTPQRRDKAADFFVECLSLQFIAVELLDSLKYNFEWWDRFDSDVEQWDDRIGSAGWEPKYVRYSDCEKILYPSI